jgi:PKD repeat protein
MTRSNRRHALPVTIASLVLLLSATLGTIPVQASDPVTNGYRDYQYNEPEAPGADDVTASRNQSKLWFNDGIWWGLLFDPKTTPNAVFRIWKFDTGSQSWTNTGRSVDNRNRSHADVLWSGAKLYVASAHGTTELRVYRFSYNSTSETYTLDSGFPKTVPNTSTGTGYATIGLDSTGELWITFTQANRVRVSTSTDAAVTWSTPFDLPNMGNDIASDDIATIVKVGSGGTTGMGVLWSNQSATDDAFYFVAHLDTSADGTWQARETALGGPGTYTADNHMSVRTDGAGRLVAAIKTSMDGDPAPNGGDPLIAVIRRSGAANAVGTWESHTVTTVTLKGTRPVLVLDTANNEANVFLTYPTLDTDGNQSIRRRTASLTSLDFGTAALGSQFIQSSTEVAINDATSSKQNATSASGMLVMATDIPTRTYLHNCTGNACATAPVADFSGTPLTGGSPLTVNFTDTSTHGPTGWSWTFGDTGTSTTQDPSHQYTKPGRYTVALTASNIGGSDGETKTDYITVYFADTLSSTFKDDILWIYQEGITFGCAPNNYCPTAPVTREQMASFLVRAFDLPPTATDYFTDDTGTTHEHDINALRAAGITVGCAATLYCPKDPVPRDQMASFLARALALPPTGTDYFTDDNGNTHEQNINRIRKADITTGCTATTYCPKEIVTRGQMAAFLRRSVE